MEPEVVYNTAITVFSLLMILLMLFWGDWRR